MTSEDPAPREQELAAGAERQSDLDQQLKDAQALYRSALAAGRLGTWETDLVARTRFWTPEGMALFGLNLPDGRGHVGGPDDEYWSALHPDDRHLMREFHDLADRQDLFESEYRVVWPDGTILWLRGHGRVVARTADGKAHRLVSIVADITERKRVEQALRDSEERLRLASEAAQIGIWDYDLSTNVLRWDDRTRALFGLSPDARVDYEVFLAGLHPADREATHQAVERSLDPSGSGEYDIEYRTVGIEDGITRWIAAKGKCFFEKRKAVRFIGTVLDIGRAKTAEELQQMLLREMDHRVNNVFAILSSMTALTARFAATPQDMSRSLLGRLDALSRANGLLRLGAMVGEQMPGERTTIGRLATTLLSPYAQGATESERVILSGPEVTIGAKAATSLALVLHESATNAAKYGALSQPDGRVRISWAVQGDHLDLRWEETGGPLVASPPTLKRFGSTLIERSIVGQLGGTFQLAWPPSGMTMQLTVSLHRLGMS